MELLLTCLAIFFNGTFASYEIFGGEPTTTNNIQNGDILGM
jgi:hypothetical protein